jgi:hypothetical protein
MKTFNELLEAASADNLTIYEISCRDYDNALKNLLECIKAIGNTGHSFSIIVDPEEKEGLKDRTFYWDGDGADHIKEIKIIQDK